MTNTDKPLEEQTKSKLLTVPIQPGYEPAIDTCARLENRSVADYIRNCLLRDMRDKGVLDEQFLPVAQVAS
jgi:hypothetical protein